eukprot:CAMPEP_0115547130 /NCGR_PEP_ID=MMETSP0271-20121206/93485_1 /TAXON_ID=71861 /ORGANISM="Scrippsiella trochoidea, Strain CCMP3099" /LENGTH=99 /DNA_ID=CAMNT_0002980547 /DNA_START=1477 /DNA_END=1773 /DNA_ORIENTATION=-
MTSGRGPPSKHTPHDRPLALLAANVGEVMPLLSGTIRTNDHAELESPYTRFILTLSLKFPGGEAGNLVMLPPLTMPPMLTLIQKDRQQLFSWPSRASQG